MKLLDCIMEKLVKRKWCLSKGKINKMAVGSMTVLINNKIWLMIRMNDCSDAKNIY